MEEAGCSTRAYYQDLVCHLPIYQQSLRCLLEARESTSPYHIQDATRRVYRVLKHTRNCHSGQGSNCGSARSCQRGWSTQDRSERRLRGVRAASAHRRSGLGCRLLCLLRLQGMLLDCHPERCANESSRFTGRTLVHFTRVAPALRVLCHHWHTTS